MQKYEAMWLNISKVKRKNFVDKSDLSGFIDNSHFDKKTATSAVNAELNCNQD